tara:strand:- start:81 stop:272 length:192 start_codon:yes stop_codon:yes gene_type:complete
METTDHPLKYKKKPIDEILIFIKDIRSEMSIIKREITQIKNEVRKLNEHKNKDTDATRSGWFY